MHKLLVRQLKRFLPKWQPEGQETRFLQAVSDAYEQTQQELDLMQQSLFVTSNELNERNRTLKQQLAELTQTQSELHNTISTMQATFDATGEVIFVFAADNQFVECNSMGQQFIDEVLQGKPPTWQNISQHASNTGLVDDIFCSLREDPMRLLTGLLELKNGQYYAVRSLPQKRGEQLLGRVWCMSNVTQQTLYKQAIEHQAYHDALTDLPNRLLLLDRISHALTLAKRSANSLAILFIDLDNFKKVNDTEGHEAGDLLLINVVKRIKSRLREQDTLARLGGDEFVILLESVNSQAAVTHLCKSLLELLGKPFEVQGRQHFISCSIGVSVSPQDDKEADALIRKADMAMYRAKELGKNNFQFYSPKLESTALQQLDIERRLRKAISDNKLSVAFQPTVDVRSQRIVGAEVLARWTQSDGSSIPPADFIPVAEQTGLVTHISRLVIGCACQQLAEWRAQGITDMKLAVNFPSLEFQDRQVIGMVLGALHQYQVPGKQLVIEVTESLFMEDKDKVQAIMQELREAGVSFALDDFGKGYSSFSYLQTLPMDYLKIDKAFLREVTTNKQSSAIARTIIDVGRNLEMLIIAEGIEDQATLDYTLENGCEQAQGYYLYRPMQPERLTLLLEQQFKQTV